MGKQGPFHLLRSLRISGGSGGNFTNQSLGITPRGPLENPKRMPARFDMLSGWKSDLVLDCLDLLVSRRVLQYRDGAFRSLDDHEVPWKPPNHQPLELQETGKHQRKHTSSVLEAASCEARQSASPCLSAQSACSEESPSGCTFLKSITTTPKMIQFTFSARAGHNRQLPRCSRCSRSLSLCPDQKRVHTVRLGPAGRK